MPAPLALRRVAVAAGAAVTSVTLAGCLTGERPVLSDGTQLTGDAAADAVIERLIESPRAVFSADFTIATTQDPPATADATVLQRGQAERLVTIGSTQFIIADDDSATCDTETGECERSILDNRVSDLAVTSGFYGASQAQRLRTDVRLRSGPTEASTETIAGESATCVTVPVAATSSVYCALDNGVLARLQSADVVIEMTSYTETVETAIIVPPS